MKRIGIITALSGLLLFGLFQLVALAGPPSTPTIDGVIGSDWATDELVVDDSLSDSAWGSSNELDNLYLTWDATNLYIGLSQTLELNNNATILYLDTAVSGGETNFHSNTGYTGAYPRNVTFSNHDINFMLARWGHNAPQAYAIVDNTATDVGSQITTASSSNGTAVTAEFAIPWTLLGSSYEDPFCLVSIIAGGDNWGSPDSMPNNPDTNGDGGPDALDTLYCFNYSYGVRINEIRTDQPSTDNDEYFELSGPIGQSLDNLTYLVIGDTSGGGSGVIEAVVNLTGYTINSNGYFVVAESTFTLGTADLTVGASGLNFENSDNTTHLLVQGFTGANGDDLDTNNDGTLDATPWANILDLIAIILQDNPPTTTEYHYGPPTVGPDGLLAPGHVYSCNLGGWQIGQFDPVGGDDTPGAANTACPTTASELVIGKTGPAIVTSGQSVTYDILLENTDAGTATNILITDTLPLHTTYVSADLGTPSNPTPGVYVWNVGDLAGLSSASYQITVTVAATLTEGTVLTNTISVSTDEPGDTTAGNTDTAVSTVLDPFTSSGELTFNHIGGFSGSGAEITAYDPISQTLFVVTGGPYMELIDISNPLAPTLKGTIAISPTYGAAANSVAFSGDLAAVAVEAMTRTLPGKVVFFDRNGAYVHDVTVGALPDMLTFTPDGQRVVIANEGEPGATDPLGMVSIIDLSAGVGSSVVTNLDFTHFTTATLDPAVRIFPGKTVAEDVEPEYVAISPDGLTAWVTLQEANALAIVDMTALTITQISPLGFKDHSLAGNELDPSDQDGGIAIANWPVWGMYMPDSIGAYQANGQLYLLTANEGDARTETARINSLTLDPTAFPNAATLQLNANLGRLDASTINGDTDGDTDYDQLYVYGGRSFSIWDATTGAQLFDSGSQFEQATAVLSPATFNSNGDPGTFDTRSDNKGPEPEGLTEAVLNGQTYAFIGLERTGGLMVYNVSDPANPTFADYLPPAAGDVSPEGVLFIPAPDSPTGNPLLVLAYEVSHTIAIYEISFDADLSVSKSGPALLAGGDTYSYTVTIDNLASGVAANVVLTDTLPTPVTYITDDSGLTPVNPATGVYVWDLGDVPPETAVTIHITVTLGNITSPTTLINQVQISTTSPNDPSGDNSADTTATAYPLVTIHDVQYVPDPATSELSPLLGQVVWVEGIVTAEPGEIDTPSRTFIIAEPAGGPWSGLPIFKSNGYAGLVAPEGTAVRVLGTVTEFSTSGGASRLTEMNLSTGPAAVIVLSTGHPVPAPVLLSTADFNDVDSNTSEQWEGVLLEFRQATVTDEDLGFSEWYFNDGSGDVRADDFGDLDGDLTYVPALGDYYNAIRGIGWDSFAYYKLAPRYDADIDLRIFALGLSKDAATLVQPGELLTYTLTVDNPMAPPLTGVVITDVVPANSTFAYALDGGSYSNGIVTWNIVNIAGFGSASVRFVVTAANSITQISNDTYAVYASNFLTPTFGAAVVTAVDTAMYIRTIQGAQHQSPLAGRAVQGVAGIVTAVGSNNFYLQDPTPDSGPNANATSEGIVVYTGSTPTVHVGDAVKVSGTVQEFFAGGDPNNLSTTELINPSITLVSSGNPLPAPLVVGNGGRIPPTAVIDDDANGNVNTSGTFDADSDGIDFYESLEGMLIQVNNAIVVGSNAFGEIHIVGDNGANASLLSPRGGIVIQSSDYNPERIILDDVLTSAEPTVTVGDAFTGIITGVVDYSFGNFKVLNPAPLPPVAAGSLPPETTPLTGTVRQLTVASFNVLNLDPGDGTQFNDLAEIIVHNMQSPDIIALEEIQDNTGPANDGTVDASATYAALITAVTAAGGPTYEFRDIAPQNNQDGGEPGGNIRVGFLFNPARVTFIDRPGGTATNSTTPLLGPTGIEMSYSPGRIDPLNAAFSDSRKPLVGEFLFNGQKVIVIGNHLNSKGGDTALFGSWQPPILSSEAQRVAQAQVINDFVDSILALDAQAHVVVLGDLNDFQFSPPLQTLRADVLTDLITTLPLGEQYTYLYDGNSQALDHILASGSLSVTAEFDAVHVNAEYPVNARPSDHDPIVARFTLPLAMIDILSPADGTVYTDTTGLGITLPVTVTTGSAFNIPADGHWNLWLDGAVVGPVMGYGTAVTLLPGIHTLTAELLAADGTPLGPVDTVTVTVNTPRQYSIAIVAPGNGTVYTTTNGASATFTMTVDTGDFTIPTHGHWGLWVDGSVVGAVYGYSTAVTLTTGTHVISAELRAPDQTPLGPTDSLLITVNTITIPPSYELYLPIITSPATSSIPAQTGTTLPQIGLSLLPMMLVGGLTWRRK